jgi:hypothetical protein
MALRRAGLGLGRLLRSQNHLNASPAHPDPENKCAHTQNARFFTNPPKSPLFLFAIWSEIVEPR